LAFLDMMTGRLVTPITRDAYRKERDPSTQSSVVPVVIPAGTINGLELFEHDYLARSAVAHYQPAVGQHAGERLIAVRKPHEDVVGRISIDFLPE
jgi:hypothetical protein